MELMMDEVCGYIRNYFYVKPDGIHRGKFSIDENGQLSLPFLHKEQYFRIVGSVFNDGVYRYPADELNEETFVGEIWAMAVPPAFIALLSEIEEWQGKYGDINTLSGAINMSPFSAESFANYSYTKSKGGGYAGSGSSGDKPTTWQDVFGARLSRWRKLNVI